MAPSKSLLLRFEGKDGQFRLTVNSSDQFTSLLPQVRCLMQSHVYLVFVLLIKGLVATTDP